MKFKNSQLYITKVHCPDCIEDLINGVLLKEKGIIKAVFEDRKSLLSIDYDSELIAEKRMKEIIADMGYGFIEDKGEIKNIKKNYWLNWIVIVIVMAFLIFLIIWSNSL